MSDKNEREKQAAATRARLIQTGLKLFGREGYTAISAQDLVKEAKVTRGALYHHFKTGKAGLFEAVAEQVLVDLVTSLTTALESTTLAWEDLRPTLSAYFDAALSDEHRRIALQDAPSVLGANKWRELEYAYSVKFIEVSLEALMDNGVLRPVPVASLASLLFGAICEATQSIAVADDPPAAQTEALDVLELLLSGIRA